MTSGAGQTPGLTCATRGYPITWPYLPGTPRGGGACQILIYHRKACQRCRTSPCLVLSHTPTYLIRLRIPLYPSCRDFSCIRSHCSGKYTLQWQDDFTPQTLNNYIQANKWCSHGSWLLGQRRRRWTNIQSALGQCLVFAGYMLLADRLNTKCADSISPWCMPKLSSSTYYPTFCEVYSFANFKRTTLWCIIPPCGVVAWQLWEP